MLGTSNGIVRWRSGDYLDILVGWLKGRSHSQRRLSERQRLAVVVMGQGVLLVGDS